MTSRFYELEEVRMISFDEYLQNLENQHEIVRIDSIPFLDEHFHNQPIELFQKPFDRLSFSFTSKTRVTFE